MDLRACPAACPSACISACPSLRYSGSRRVHPPPYLAKMSCMPCFSSRRSCAVPTRSGEDHGECNEIQINFTSFFFAFPSIGRMSSLRTLLAVNLAM